MSNKRQKSSTNAKIRAGVRRWHRRDVLAGLGAGAMALVLPITSEKPRSGTVSEQPTGTGRELSEAEFLKIVIPWLEAQKAAAERRLAEIGGGGS